MEKSSLYLCYISPSSGLTMRRKFLHCLFSRLHDSSEKILDNGSDKESKLRRKRRHQLRIFLLVVDYLIESLGSICIFVVVFVADKSLWQHHLLITAGSFLYGVPIALSYLLSETRVRIIIIENGWFQGITSIFQSSEKIKQLKSNKIVECWHDKGLLACPNKQNINISETNKTDLQNKNSEVSEVNPILKDNHEIHAPRNIKNMQIDNTFASKNLSYDRTISKTNTSSLPTLASNVNQFKPTSKDNHQVQVEYNIKNGSIKNALISKSVSYDCAIHPALTSYSDTSCICEQHKTISDMQSNIKETAFYRSTSQNLFIHPSTKKYRHISIDAQYNHADEVNANTFSINHVKQDADVVTYAQPRFNTFQDLCVNRNNEESSRKSVNSDVEMADQMCNVECHKASIEMISRMDVDLTVNEIKPLSRVDNNIDCIHSIDRIVVDRDAELSKRFPSVKGNEETIESKPLMDINAVFINSVFVEQSNKVMSILSDKDFKVFSRSYILNRTIKLLDNDKNESDYQKYFHYICDLECFPECDHDNDKKLHFLVSLINVWLLNKYQNSFECENVVSNEIHMSESMNHNDMGGGCLSYERTRILNLMLLNVRNDPKYIKLLEHLYIQEDEQKEDELVYGW